MLQAVVMALLVGTAWAPSAQAGTLEVWTRPAGWGSSAATGLTFQATAGELNRLHVLAQPNSLTFVDDGAPIELVGEGCAREAADRVTCPRLGLAVTLGDGNDTFSGQALSVSGGEGDDHVLIDRGRADGGAGADFLEGSAGEEVFIGGPGSDVVDGGAGDDRIEDTGAELDADSYNGGGGRDQLSYDARPGLEVDLRRPAPNGRPGENDTLVSIEGLVGESAGARITGTDRSELFYVGRATAARPLTVIPYDCERVTDGHTEWGVFRLHLRMRSLRARLVEARSDYGCNAYDGCRTVTLTIRRRAHDGRPTGQVLGRVRAREWRPLDLRLNEAGRRALRRRGAFVGIVKLTGQRDGPFAFSTRVGLRR